MPLIIEGNCRGVSSTLYYTANQKYTNPHKYLSQLENFSKQYNFTLCDISEWASSDSFLTFVVEGVGVMDGRIAKRNLDDVIVSLAVMADYEGLYSKYIKLVDYVIFPNRVFAEEFNTLSEKNLYFGSPKYDVELKILQSRKNLRAVIIHPDAAAFSDNISSVHKVLRNAGFEIFVKNREKHGILDEFLRGDQYIVDESWFPHTTMELISNSDLVVCWDSGVRKEAIMLEKPILNFNSLGNNRVFKFLHGYDYCVDFDKNENDEQKILEGVLGLVKNDFSEIYSYVKDKYLWKHNASEKILDYFLGT